VVGGVPGSVGSSPGIPVPGGTIGLVNPGTGFVRPGINGFVKTRLLLFVATTSGCGRFTGAGEGGNSGLPWRIESPCAKAFPATSIPKNIHGNFILSAKHCLYRECFCG